MRSFRGLLAFLLCSFTAGCAAWTNPVADGMPVRELPWELLAHSKNCDHPVPMTMFGQDSPGVYRLDAGDVLGVWIDGVMDEKSLNSTTSFPFARIIDKTRLLPERSETPSTFGYPIPVRPDGTISLPLVKPVLVRNLTVEEVEDSVRKAYVDAKILQAGRERLFVFLQHKRLYQVVVFRHDLEFPGGINTSLWTTTVGVIANGTQLLGSGTTGSGNQINLPAYENDLLHALALTGGMPGVNAASEVVIFRKRAIKARAKIDVEETKPPRAKFYLDEGDISSKTEQSLPSDLPQTKNEPVGVEIRSKNQENPKAKVESEESTSEQGLENPVLKANENKAHLLSPSYVPPQTSEGHQPGENPSYLPPVVNQNQPGQSKEPPNKSEKRAEELGQPKRLQPRHSDAFERLANSGAEVIRIPLRFHEGKMVPWNPEDSILQTGDVVFVEAAPLEVFYTGGLLPSGEYLLPRDYDLDVVEAIMRVRGPVINGAFGGNNLSGALINPGFGLPSPRLVSVIRRTPQGGLVTIKVDLFRALRNPEERLVLKHGDVVILQETKMQALAQFFSEQVNFIGIFTLFHSNNTRGTLTTVLP